MTTAVTLLLLLVVATVAVQAGTYDEYRDYGVVDKTKFMKHYARKKIFESCYGKDVINEWYRCMDDILVTCHKETRKTEETKPVEDIKKTEETTITEDIAVRRRRTTTPVVTIKPPFYDEEKVRYIKDELLERIAFIKCTMDKMNVTMTANGTVDPAPHIDYLETVEMDAELKKDVVSGIEKCTIIKPCQTFKNFGPIDVEFQKKMKFIRCTQKCRMHTCIRKDFKDNRDQFELQGLDGVFDDLQDDIMKTMGIATAYASLWDDDMNLFV